MKYIILEGYIQNMLGVSGGNICDILFPSLFHIKNTH